jgi:hypothetical protein
MDQSSPKKQINASIGFATNAGEIPGMFERGPGTKPYRSWVIDIATPQRNRRVPFQ